VLRTLAFSFLSLALWVALPALAGEPTAEQLKLLQQLPPAQREALIEKYLGKAPRTDEGETSDLDTEEGEDGGDEGTEPLLTPKAKDTALPKPLEIDTVDELKRRTMLETERRRARDERDLTWCAREERLKDLHKLEAELDDRKMRSRAARTYGFDRLDDLPIPERCELLLEEAAGLFLTKKGDELKPFGADLFTGKSTTFAPSTDVPVPVDYTVGAGDRIRVQLFGKDNEEHELVVSREGVLQFPGLGPITVTGMKFEAVQRLIEQRVAQQMIGVKASVTMGALRSIRVFVLGDVKRPGSYTVSALSTLTNALFASGGVTEQGSLRAIELKRGGRLVTRLDLYDLLLEGNSRDDLRIQSGDVIFVPPVGMTIALGGEVRRPAIYEVKPGTTLERAVDLAGGLLPSAYPRAVMLERITAEDRERTVLDLDLTKAEAKNLPVVSGDVLKVPTVLDKLENVYEITGHLHRPGYFQWKPGMRLADALPNAALLREQSDLEFVLLRRESGPTRQVSVVTADLAKALTAKGGADDIALQPRDRIYVFGLDEERAISLRPLVDELRAQSRNGQPARVITVTGSVRAPGVYPMEQGMRVSTALRAAGQLAENAYGMDAELTRYTMDDRSQRRIVHVPVDLAAVLNGNSELDLLLQPFDEINIKPVPNWDTREVFEVRGEVRFPGLYPLQKGETLDSVLKRAGGLTDFAFAEGSIFMREELREREQEQLDRLAERLQKDLTMLAAEQTQSGQAGAEAVQIGQQVAREVKATKAIGRLVLDLEAVRSGKVRIEAKDGDKLFVPRKTQEVTVLGEVQYATSHLHLEELDRDDYIENSGGLTVKADEDRIFVVRANGRVDVGSASKRIGPGDTIVVPFDTERMRPLVFWSTVTQIMYQVTLAAATAKSLGAF
jgi:protein involved in polysaccharide export with SLBB domain